MSAEQWLPVVDYEGRYEVSDLGRVRSVGRAIQRSKFGSCEVKSRILSMRTDKHGNVHLRIGRTTACVHRIVAEAFIDNKLDQNYIEHIDGDGSNNAVTNLRWVDTLESVEERLHRNRVRRDSGCIEWIGSSNNQGYGSILVSKPTRKQWLVHRLVWTLSNGAIPAHMVICHKCDNPRCSNIDHLFIGTSSDNAKDMVAKGRMSSRRRLSFDQVLEIRQKYRVARTARGWESNASDIAAEYGISPSHARRIAKRQRRLNA